MYQYSTSIPVSHTVCYVCTVKFTCRIFVPYLYDNMTVFTALVAYKFETVSLPLVLMVHVDYNGPLDYSISESAN